MLIIPKRPRWHGWGAPSTEHTQQQADVEYFKKWLEEYLDKTFEGWRDYVAFTLTDKFLCFDRKETGWKVSRICKIAREKVFALSDKQKKDISDWIDKCKRDEEIARMRTLQEKEQARELERFTALALPICDKFTNADLKVESGDTIYIKTANGSARNYIYRSGEISPAEFDFRRDMGSLQDLRSLLDEFQPINEQLYNLAVEIKKELPKEWFEEMK